MCSTLQNRFLIHVRIAFAERTPLAAPSPLPVPAAGRSAVSVWGFADRQPLGVWPDSGGPPLPLPRRIRLDVYGRWGKKLPFHMIFLHDYNIFYMIFFFQKKMFIFFTKTTRTRIIENNFYKRMYLCTFVYNIFFKLL